jgi:hypothetical protein
MVVFVRVMPYGQGNCPMIRMCVQMSNIASKKRENPLTCHPCVGGNDELFASQSSLTEWELVCDGLAPLVTGNVKVLLLPSALSRLPS